MHGSVSNAICNSNPMATENPTTVSSSVVNLSQMRVVLCLEDPAKKVQSSVRAQILVTTGFAGFGVVYRESTETAHLVSTLSVLLVSGN